jgi:hypothetical protein
VRRYLHLTPSGERHTGKSDDTAGEILGTDRGSDPGGCVRFIGKPSAGDSASR